MGCTGENAEEQEAWTSVRGEVKLTGIRIDVKKNQG